MRITATELKSNLGLYLSQAGREDIIITRNGRDIAKLTSPEIDKTALWKSLLGTVPGGDEVDVEEARKETI